MTLTETAAAVVLAAAALAAVGVLVKWLRGGFRVMDNAESLLSMTADIKRIVERELQHNHGGSVKDDSHGTAVSLHLAHKRIDEIYTVLDLFAEANNLVLPLIHDAINARPPTTEGKDQ